MANKPVDMSRCYCGHEYEDHRSFVAVGTCTRCPCKTYEPDPVAELEALPDAVEDKGPEGGGSIRG